MLRTHSRRYKCEQEEGDSEKFDHVGKLLKSILGLIQIRGQGSFAVAVSSSSGLTAASKLSRLRSPTILARIRPSRSRMNVVGRPATANFDSTPGSPST